MRALRHQNSVGGGCAAWSRNRAEFNAEFGKCGLHRLVREFRELVVKQSGLFRIYLSVWKITKKNLKG